MSNLRDERTSRRRVSGTIDTLRAARKANTPEQTTCPFCDRENVRVETMSTMTGSDEGLKIGFFTCRSCNESWSGLIL